jgi:predicted SAM-dependent methyltransferase
MALKHRIKDFLIQYIPERTFEELAIHSRVLLYTTIPNRLFPARRRKLQRARQLQSIKLNIGCGDENPDGWFGIDFISRRADLCIDIGHGLPFGDETCRCIFSEHVFEHLDRATLRKVLRECHRILELNGPIRIVMPDLAKYIDAYVKNDGVLSSRVYTAHGNYSTHELMNEVFYVTTHRYIHDFASIENELRQAGFSEVSLCEHRCSRFPDFTIDDPDEHRPAISLYVEAVKAK